MATATATPTATLINGNSPATTTVSASNSTSASATITTNSNQIIINNNNNNNTFIKNQFPTNGISNGIAGIGHIQYTTIESFDPSLKSANQHVDYQHQNNHVPSIEHEYETMNNLNLKQRINRIELLLDNASRQFARVQQPSSTGTDVCDSATNVEIFTTANSALSSTLNELDVDSNNTNNHNTNYSQTNNDINTLKSLFNCPIFRRIVDVENSLESLRQQLQLHPSIVPQEFDLDETSGELILTPPVLTSPVLRSAKIDQKRNSNTTNSEQSILSQQQKQIPNNQNNNKDGHQQQQQNQPRVATVKPASQELPEMERFEVILEKQDKCLGITIAGYICEKEELAGIFIKSISPGSSADLNGKIQINDQIYSVDGIPLKDYTNHEAVDLLRKTGSTVRLGLMRYLRGAKFQKLQKAHRLTTKNTSTNNNSSTHTPTSNSSQHQATTSQQQKNPEMTITNENSQPTS